MFSVLQWGKPSLNALAWHSVVPAVPFCSIQALSIEGCWGRQGRRRESIGMPLAAALANLIKLIIQTETIHNNRNMQIETFKSKTGRNFFSHRIKFLKLPLAFENSKSN